MIPPIETLEEFLAHAIAIEHEAVQRYREFETHFASRGEEVLGGLCRNLATLEGEHLQRFFDWVARTSPVETVRSLAREIAREEAQHVLWLKQALGDDSQCKTDTGVACDVNYQ